ncbi:MAG: pyridoxine 5'-phosphate synthase [candidate division Zixibacteria bacterium 4484_93]|nr:MAG: pyridoxine 5'-phosphate synthase [candidate division Zixibacteria bacterium 4484_93]
MARLSVNIDHIATLREARGNVPYPEPVFAVGIIESAGADGITVHLRGDRRHIQERDLMLLRQVVSTHLTLEIAPNDDVLNIAKKVKPDMVTLVPESSSEKTTTGGLNLLDRPKYIENAVTQLQHSDIVVSAFVEPDPEMIKAAAELGFDFVEINTKSYVEAKNLLDELDQYRQIEKMAAYANKLRLGVNVGHGLSYQNVRNLARLKTIEEFSIGHSIIARAVFIGLYQAVKDMLKIIRNPEP